MKTVLALLVTGLLFLTTPVLAAADGRHHDGVQNHHQSWGKNDRHDRGYYYDHHGQRRNHRYNNKRNYRHDQKHNHHTKKHLRQKLRETRQELHQVKRQIRHNHRRPYYVRSYYADPVVVIGLPHFVFQFDW